ncbi:MAG: glycosyltransferase family 4 protein [Roseburia sp.]|nr:glycosyltransferase family 4 protein [Roseburia sp.]
MSKKILFITAFPPNEKTAGQDYTRRLILDLLEKKYKIDLIYAEYPKHEINLPKEVNIVARIRPQIINCIKKFYVHPFFSKRYNYTIKNYIQNIADKYDMLYFDFSQVHLYSKYIQHPCKVLMCHDVICQKYSRKMGKLNVAWIRHWENKLLKSAKNGFTFSNKDKYIIKDIYGIDTIPVNFYLKTEKYKYSNREHITCKMCFYGAWNRKENIEALEYFINYIYPKLKNKRDFSVIGGGMDEHLKEKLENNGIECLGFVDDPISSIATFQALIAPLHQGAGVKVKVVDALTAGTPVIGTSVAFEGLEDNINNPLFYLAERKDEFVKIIDNWKVINREYKQDAANEFYDRYNCRHFPDIIDRIL